MIVTNPACNKRNLSRIYTAAMTSVFIHMMLAVFIINKEPSHIYMENNVISTHSSRIHLNISKLPEQKNIKTIHAKPKLQKINTPKNQVKSQENVVSTTVETTSQTLAQDHSDDIIPTEIPVIENARYKGTRSPPIYPKRSITLNQEGVVLLKVLIDKDGSVKNALILSSSGYTLLDNSAMEAVLKWKFEPLIIDGKKSLSWVKIPIEFIIK